MVMLNLERRALEWHHFYSQRDGGLQMPSWPAYIKSLQDRFGCGPFGDPIRELVNLKQQGSIFSLKFNNVGVVANTLHYGTLNMSIGATAIVSSGTGCLDTGQFMYQKGATFGAPLGNGQIENSADSGLAYNSQQTDTSTDVDADHKKQLHGIQHGAVMVNTVDQPKSKSGDQKTLCRLA
ncbi:hypothetical protein V6Z11_D12G102500 [Gossypium hirsutum]|uniref:Transcription factor PERIANTHIA-like n=1 Tax=Gossypium hirsutum TaxID=3635 RepID=A0ABM3B9X3_GOSHI|nr:transcription factor PERIANTHIA-like [Gossypium hirsutum]